MFTWHIFSIYIKKMDTWGGQNKILLYWMLFEVVKWEKQPQQKINQWTTSKSLRQIFIWVRTRKTCKPSTGVSLSTVGLPHPLKGSRWEGHKGTRTGLPLLSNGGQQEVGPKARVIGPSGWAQLQTKALQTAGHGHQQCNLHYFVKLCLRQCPHYYVNV